MKNKALLTAVILLAPVLLAADPVTYPKLKAGRWETSTTFEKTPPGMPANMTQGIKMIHCIDDTSQEKMIAGANQTENCSKPDIKQSGNTYTVNLTCNHGGRETKVTSQTTFKSDTEISGRSQISTAGSPEMEMLFSAKYLGECPGQMKPGDIQMQGPNGMPMNIPRPANK